jgi:hypothetical protein
MEKYDANSVRNAGLATDDVHLNYRANGILGHRVYQLGTD